MLTDAPPTTNASAYWDAFYADRKPGRHAPRYPSQFAAFAVNELQGIDTLVEFGCGNGRDSEFFASYGLDVLAMDGSATAIEGCRRSSRNRNIAYRCADISEATPCLADFVTRHGQEKATAVYARFFLHAITAAEQMDFLDMLAEQLPDASLALFEYRTTGDKAERKEFGTHYRRFVEHTVLLDALSARGFAIEYEIESRGLAKYRNEDAMVGRCVARKL